MRRHRANALRAIEGLDPVEDYQEVYSRLVMIDAGATMAAGLNLAFYRTFAAPEIAKLLAETRVGIERPEVRAMDTAILMFEMIMHGFDHPRGKAAVARMNRIHSAFGIDNADHLFVLSALAVIPMRFLDRYGYRHSLAQEKTASAQFYRNLGRLMALREVPETYAQFEAYLEAYEAERFVYTDAARELMLATTSLMAIRFPARVRGLVGPITATMMDRHMRTAVGVRRPLPGLTSLVRIGVRAGALRARRRDPIPTHRFPDGVVAPVGHYPDGYKIDEVGSSPSATQPQAEVLHHR